MTLPTKIHLWSYFPCFLSFLQIYITPISYLLADLDEPSPFCRRFLLVFYWMLQTHSDLCVQNLHQSHFLMRFSWISLKHKIRRKSSPGSKAMSEPLSTDRAGKGSSYLRPWVPWETGVWQQVGWWLSTTTVSLGVLERGRHSTPEEFFPILLS